MRELASAGRGDGGKAGDGGTQRSIVTQPSALTSLELAGKPLDNRLAFVATVNNLGRNLEVTDAQIAFYEARARGGTGLIVTEGMSVHPTSLPNTTVPLAFEDSLVPGLRRLADAVHEHDRPIYGQLWHVGRQALWSATLQPWSASGERDPYSGATPHVMSDDEVLEVIDGFRRSAANLREAGFDGVELHGAHGYLLTQFLSPFSNRRTDRWGGSLANRVRIVIEIVRAIRRDCGEDFAVALKLTAHEYVDGGLDLDASEEIVDLLLDEVALDYIAVSQANFSPSLEYHVADLRFDDAPFAHLARGIRKAARGRAPVMALCKVPDVQTASRLIDEGSADLVGMSRALLADPAIVEKSRRGERPRPCIYCNVCWEYIHTGRPAHCVYAPETAREAGLAPREAGLARQSGARAPALGARPLQISVLGAGPAGLEFARVAAARGHHVEVHEREQSPGGRFRRMSEVSGLERYDAAVRWMTDEALDAGAQIAFGDGASAGAPAGASAAASAGASTDAPAAGDVDLLVVATGATPVVEPLDGCDPISLEQALADPSALADPVFVVDEIEAEPAYAAVEQLVAAGRDVRLITRRASIGRRVAYVSLIGVLRRLDSAGVEVHTLLSPTRVEQGRLRAVHAFSRREHDLGPVGTVVRAGPYVATEAGGSSTIVIGDASAPREALAVVYEANRRASELPDLRGAGASRASRLAGERGDSTDSAAVGLSTGEGR